MSNPITIAIDAMGGENSPKKVIEGIEIFLKNEKNINFLLYGNENQINECLKNCPLTKNSSLIHHTDVYIQDNESPLSAAKKGKTLVAPFFIGPKYSNMMSLTHFFDRKFKDIDLIHNSDEILLHQNVLVWMKKAAYKFLPISHNEQIGVVIMPHGATKPYNDAVEKKLNRIHEACGNGDNIMLPIIEASKVYATMGEIVESMKKEFGEWQESAVF